MLLTKGLPADQFCGHTIQPPVQVTRDQSLVIPEIRLPDGDEHVLHHPLPDLVTDQHVAGRHVFQCLLEAEFGLKEQLLPVQESTGGHEAERIALVDHQADQRLIQCVVVALESSPAAAFVQSDIECQFEAEARHLIQFFQCLSIL